MGVPHLAQLLQPYAVSTVLGCKTLGCEKHGRKSDDPKRHIVIDGPGLAYHVYNHVLGGKPATLNALDAIPSYTEIGYSVIEFLDELQKYGLVIDRVCFDGYLPPRKLGTRLKRLENYRRELLKFKANHPRGVSISPGPETSNLYQDTATASRLLDSTASYSKAHRSLPAAPFLVASVIESLDESAYTCVTEVVPGEADPFCAQAVRDPVSGVPGALILMNDSDFLVHDLGQEGATAFLNQLETYVDAGSIKGNKCETLRVSMFQNHHISQRLGLESTKRLAFEIKTNPSTTLKAAVRRAHSPSSDPDLLRGFLAEYSENAWKEDLPDHATNIAMLKNNKTNEYLDPRVSELVLQTTLERSERRMNICLPVLIEDPSRASAWNVTMLDRNVGYSCLQLCVGGRRVQEVCRKGDRVGTTKIDSWSEKETAAQASFMLTRIQDCLGCYNSSAISPYGKWRSYAVSQVYPPDISVEDRVAALKGNPTAKVWSWEDIQLEAEIQAVLYSLRIVRQIFQYLISVGAALPNTVLELNQALTELPPLKVLMPTRLEVLQRGNDEQWDWE